MKLYSDLKNEKYIHVFKDQIETKIKFQRQEKHMDQPKMSLWIFYSSSQTFINIYLVFLNQFINTSQHDDMWNSKSSRQLPNQQI